MENRYPFQTAGRRRLCQILKKRTQREVAELCGVSQPTVSDWKWGKARPDDANQEALEELGIPRVWWLTKQERRAKEKQRLERARMLSPQSEA